MATLITKRFRNATRLGLSREEAGGKARWKEERERHGEERGEIVYRGGEEEGSEERTTFEMHYSWGVRRYDMIQYVARPYLLTADETCERERGGGKEGEEERERTL